MATIFSRIVAGEIPCYKVAENDKFFAFLDINPLVKGHTLVIPKQEVDYIFDLSDEDLAAMHMQSEKDMLFSNPKLQLSDDEFKAVAEAIRTAL